MAEGARLEIVYTAKPYRGFESPSLRHIPSTTAIAGIAAGYQNQKKQQIFLAMPRTPNPT